MHFWNAPQDNDPNNGHQEKCPLRPPIIYFQKKMDYKQDILLKKILLYELFWPSWRWKLNYCGVLLLWAIGLQYQRNWEVDELPISF